MKPIFRYLFLFSLIVGPGRQAYAQYGLFDSTTVNISVSGVYPLDALIYKPSDLATAPSNKRWPLIIFLHGVGEAGTNLSALLNTGLPKKINQGQRPVLKYVNFGGYTTEAFVICPQNGSFSLDPNRLPPLLRDMTSRFRIDSTRIYLTGLSAGGNILGMLGGYSTAATDTAMNKYISAQFARSPHNGSMVLDSAHRVGQRWKTPTALICGAVNDGGTENAFRQFCIDLQNRLDNYYTNSFYEAVAGWGHNNFDVTYDTARRYPSLGNRNFYEWLAQYTNTYATSYNGNTGNNPPTATAVADKTVSLQTGSFTISGSGVDTDGSITTYNWTKVSGGTANIINPGSPTSTVTGFQEGTYKFRLTVTDNAGGTHFDDMLVHVVDSGLYNTSNTDAYTCTNAFRIVVLGSSTAQGAGSVPYYDSAWAGKFRTYIRSKNPSMELINLANSGYTSYHILRPTGYTAPSGRPAVDTAKNITKALSLNPDAIIINLASNDAYNGYTLAEQQANFEATMALANAANVPVWVTTSQPRTSMIGSNIPLLTAFRDWVYTRFGSKAINFWDVVSNLDSTTINPIYSAGDGIHINNLGHHVLYKKVVEEHILDSLCNRLNAPAANIAPVASAGANQTITLPISVVTLTGSGTDADGSIASYSWTKVSGGPAVIVSVGSAVTLVTGLTAGTYVFRLTVTDDDNATATANVTVQVNNAATTTTTAPTANAGLDQTLVLPQNFTTLYGGWPSFSKKSANGGPITQWNWRQISGPNTAILSKYEERNVSISAVDSAIFLKGLALGTYDFELSITDSAGGTDKDTVRVTVQNCNYNATPKSITISAGVYWPKDAAANHNIRPGDTIKLNASTINANTIDITLGGFNGCQGQPVVIMPINGQVNMGYLRIANPGDGAGNIKVSYLHIDGSGVPSQKYGIRMKGLVVGTADHVEVNNVSITNSNQIGIATAIADNVNLERLFPVFYQRGLYIHDNYVANHANEGMYIGSTSYGPGGWNYGNPIQARGDSVYVYNNIIENTGWDAMQVGSCGYSEIFNNYTNVSGTSNVGGQVSGINIGSGTYGKMYNNVIRKAAGQGSVIAGYDSIKVYNNYFDSCSYLNTTATNFPTILYSFGSHHQPEAVNAQRLVITNNYFRNPYNAVRAIQITDYNNLADPGRVDSNKLCMPNLGSVNLSSFIFVNDNAGSTATGNTAVCTWTIPTLPLAPVCGPTLADPLRQNCGNTAPNQAPVANAGTNITITLPVNTVTLNGNGTDPDGVVQVYAWRKLTGSTATIVNPASAQTAVNSLVQGVYTFELTVTDNGGLTDTDTVQVTVNPAANQAPVANAGPDRTMTLPTNSTTLSGSGTDVDGSISAYLWTKLTGPTTFTLSSTTIAAPNLTNLVQGVYTFQLRVTDNGGLTDTDTVQVTVNAAANQAPVANAGPDRTMTLPTNSTTLSGSGTDADGSISGYLWTKLTGPTTYTLSSTTVAVPDLTNLIEGVYTFQLRVTDNGGLTDLDTVQVTVYASVPSNQAPVANAGPDRTITLPTSNTTLNGSGTDTDGSISSYQWSKLTGPNTYTIVSPASAVTNLSGLVQGVYTFELTVIDNGGLSDKDTVQVTVNAAPNQAPTANAGPDRNITLPTNNTTLNGSGTDPDGSIASYQWSKIAGPGSFTINSPASAVTNITNLVQGVYLFELRVTDNGGLTDRDTVQVTVNAAVTPTNQAPVANAGNNLTITLPIHYSTLTGSGTDADGTVAAYAWRKISGPNEYTIVNASSAVTDVNSMVAGIYQYELRVTDNQGAYGYDTVSVTVLGNPNTRPGFLEFKVYPNPVTGNTANLYMAFDSTGEKYTICVYSMLGNRVFQSETLQTLQTGVIYPLDISRFRKGVYIVRLVFADERRIFTRFIKQ
ncbi:MAG: GDSL-type esterase/lipase family protein [Chitinophagaceae bacterium]|nr:GDSL-type esterase/lipase family protein [Chitinophagaceae bacterium]